MFTCLPFYVSWLSWYCISAGDQSTTILDLLALNPALDPALNPSLTPTIVTPVVKSKPKKKKEQESHPSWSPHTYCTVCIYSGDVLQEKSIIFIVNYLFININTNICLLVADLY